MYCCHSKLVSLSKLVKVTDNNGKHYFNLHYESGMLYDTGPKSSRQGFSGPPGACTITD